ncbi:ABC transporter ATP-binding protein [Oryzomonas japonica]|uniref:ABC transporter ATP-binding protein n=1 Tax=Oryzomonas japonica TaxID=2603858 RepID=A0A7J4ZQ23_9BACT|nr:ABC transporter ATP-binding protein [Oryzomonas japonica]KAB0664859.1 ABC transporter ATP-binding protein [Oryzomonas japonica]
MSTVITVENLGKKYLLRHQSGKQPYVALRDVLSDGVRNLGRKLLGRSNATERGAEQEEFWAIKDVSFEVKQGDRIGIIGRNGAGKSTLLKILSRITEPTTGSIRIKGRVASLLEVGTGFHPELTGRENIYLNGAILGMGRAEIKKKFDEIVDFAEIEKFLDTPVKRYSSGMYVRLAFAVAAHLEPEILVVDEVLAVGDAQFQKKCLGKMEDVSAKEGRTVLFVSHNMGAINKLCNDSIWIHHGRIHGFGNSSDVIRVYNASVAGETQTQLPVAGNEFAPLSVRSLQLVNADNVESVSFSCDEPVRILMSLEISHCIPGMYGYVEIFDQYGETILVSDTFDAGVNILEQLGAGVHDIELHIPPRTLGHGEYSLTLDFSSPQSDRTIRPDSTSVLHLDRVLRFSLDDFTTTRGNTRRGHLSTIIAWKTLVQHNS